MNLKTTILLVLLTGAGIGGWYWWDARQSAQTPSASPTLEFLHNDLTAAKLKRIEVSRLPAPLDPLQNAAGLVGMVGAGPGHGLFRATSLLAPRSPQTLVLLEKTGGDWNLPGNWPVRPQEIEQYLAVLTSLHSRFAPQPLDEHPDLKKFGLAEAPLLLKVTTGSETHTLQIGEEPDETHRFTRSTFLRLDDKPEVIRLGSGVFTALNRPLDYFRQRRLFPVERVAKDEDSREKVEQLDAVEVDVISDAGKFVIQKNDKDWLLKEAYKKKDKDWLHVASHDRLDPAKRDALLRAFPDLWAESFITMKTLEDCGLKDPAYTITVTRQSGAKITLFVGKVARVNTKITLKQGGPTPMPQEIREEFRYAKLDKNEQIFEIKTDKLGDITVAVDSLRDPQLARFKTDDVKRLEIQHGNETLLFAKVKENENDKDSKKEKWRLEKPHRRDVEGKQVEDFLDKLAGLQARDDAILDKADAKETGLDKPAATIKITLEEGKDDKKKTRAIGYTLGVKEADKGNVFVKVDGWPRINKVGSEIWTLAKRSELAYRPRELWKLDRDAITRITVDSPGKSYHLDHNGKTWKIGGPIEMDATGPEPEQLADELAHLRCERFEAPKGADLAKYGLDKPAFTITVAAKDKKTHTVEIGKKDESKEGGRFARLKDGDAVFVLSEKLAANFHADPLDFLDKNLPSFNTADIERIRYQGAANFALEKKKGQWQVVDSPAPAFNVNKDAIDNVLKPWQKLRAEKIAAVGPKIAWADYGLDKPSASVVLTLAESPGEKTKDHVVELGKEAKDGGRYARFDKKDTVVVLPSNVAEQLSRTYLDFVDSRVMRPFDSDAVARIERKMGGADLELVRRDDAWQIVKPSVREGDLLTIFDLLRRVSALQAKRIAAYPAKDLKEFGLAEPAAIVTVTLDFDGTTKKHVIKVGALTKAKGEKDERFALVDDKPMVIVLPAELSRHLTAAPLYFADRNLVSFSGADRAELVHGKRKLTFARGDAGWQIVDPIKADADSAAVDDLMRGLQRLRADEIVADKGADLKKFGLDPPVAQWRFQLGNEDQVNLLIGAPENAEPGARRYAKLANRNTVFLLNPKTAARALGEFRSKKVWPPFDAAKAEELSVTGPTGSFTLKKKDKDWTVVGQPKAMVKPNIVDDTIDMLSTLAAHHFVIDAKAELKAYGLDKPAWKLEVKTPMGKHEVWLGAMEDKSKQPFATIPGTGTVFVIDEIDNIILARPLASYLVEEEKKK